MASEGGGGGGGSSSKRTRDYEKGDAFPGRYARYTMVAMPDIQLSVQLNSSHLRSCNICCLAGIEGC